MHYTCSKVRRLYEEVFLRSLKITVAADMSNKKKKKKADQNHIQYLFTQHTPKTDMYIKSVTDLILESTEKLQDFYYVTDL